jgi:hypothetical protein
MAASTTAWVPHSTSPSRRTCGNAPGPRPPVGRPNAATLAGVSATSSVVPSSATSRHPRYHAPSSCGSPAAGRPRRTAPAAAPAQPGTGAGYRALVRNLPAPGPRQALDQQPHDLLVAHQGEQAHGQGVGDDHAGGQQPPTLLGPPGPGEHPIHSSGGKVLVSTPIAIRSGSRGMTAGLVWPARGIRVWSPPDTGPYLVRDTLVGAAATTPTVATKSGRGADGKYARSTVELQGLLHSRRRHPDGRRAACTLRSST